MIRSNSKCLLALFLVAQVALANTSRLGFQAFVTGEGSHQETYFKMGPGVMDTYMQLKDKHKYRYLILKLDISIGAFVIEKAAPFSAGYDDFLKDLLQSSPRFAVYLWSLGGGGKYRIPFISWIPDRSNPHSQLTSSQDPKAPRLRFPDSYPEIEVRNSGEITRQKMVEIIAAS